MSAQTTPSVLATRGPVLVIGTGLLGTSLALALRAGDVAVQLADTSPTCLALARDMGAGTPRPAWQDDADTLPEPALVVVATPPDVAAGVVVAALERFPHAVVTDVASVKARVVAEVRERAGQAARRYVGSHPMAGRERSGAAAADSDLFVGRPWVLVAGDVPERAGEPQAPTSPDPTAGASRAAGAAGAAGAGQASDPAALLAVQALAVDVGATPIRMDATEHDAAVAAVSHVPQLVSSLLAARLETLPESALALAGQGLRDTTRIAASDPRLWAAILVGNAGPVTGLLEQVRHDLDTLIAGMSGAAATPATADPMTPGAVGAITDVMGRGNLGRARIPGKHGGAPRRYAEVQVLVPDSAGELGRLFSDVGAAGVNIEDFAMEHSAGQSAGIAQLSVVPVAARRLEQALDARGWRVVAG